MAIPAGYENFQVGDRIQWVICGRDYGGTSGVVTVKTEEIMCISFTEGGIFREDYVWDEDWSGDRHWRVTSYANPLEVL